MHGQDERLSHGARMADIGLFGKEVLPEVRKWLGHPDIIASKRHANDY